MSETEELVGGSDELVGESDELVGESDHSVINQMSDLQQAELIHFQCEL